MYQIDIDNQNNLVTLELRGMMSLGEVSDFIAKLRQKLVEHQLREYVMVIEVSEMPIQSQDIIVAFGSRIGSMPKARSIAIVTGKSLGRMQLKRLFTQPYARITSSLSEARAWVLEGIEPNHISR